MAPTRLINIKLLLIGNPMVGKSSLLLRFSDKQWLPEDKMTATIAADSRVRSTLLSLFTYIDDDRDVGYWLCWLYTSLGAVG